MIRKLTVREFLEMNDIEWNDIKEFGDSRVGATEDIDENEELTLYIDENPNYSLIVYRNDNKWNDNIPVICGNIDNWNI